MRKEKYQLDFILLNIGYAEHHADWNWKNINSPFTRIHVVKKGTAWLKRDGNKYQLKEGHLYLTPSYTPHSYECGDEFCLYYIHIYETLEKKSSVFDQLNFPIEIEGDSLLLDLIERLYAINPGRELSFYDPDAYDNSTELIKNIAMQGHTPLALELESHGIIQQLISRFFAFATQKMPNVDERMARVLEYIHSNIHTPIGIDQLAEMSFLTKDHFIRLFKKQLNCTPGKYINQKKIEKAQLMMLLQNYSVQELAFQLGFENVSYFNRLFKKLTGENPTNYRKRLEM
ncbi:helix-turn-helix domain-containing protein [Sphingobacterium corticibacterium]|uniref:Helix-turn-helix domain-containing protein n=1 Tax=Sphingobacterium corticibacterium TaxID=2484746 RepID=A0A4Q6XIW8_9SPHI|nr:helix-turn-helix domain-containing protein [Sphingobacterium corticibacterium]RZF59821.1 helix-turn-helix domain-containing protein [Sphingobacterium corticibacterium]